MPPSIRGLPHYSVDSQYAVSSPPARVRKMSGGEQSESETESLGQRRYCVCQDA